MSESQKQDARSVALELLADTDITNLTFFQGRVTKDPDWSTVVDSEGKVTLGGEFVQVSMAVGSGYETVRCFDEAFIEWALSLGAESVIQVVCERVNKPRKQGEGWSTYWQTLVVAPVKVEARKAKSDRAGAVARRKKALEEGSKPRTRAVRILACGHGWGVGTSVLAPHPPFSRSLIVSLTRRSRDMDDEKEFLLDVVTNLQMQVDSLSWIARSIDDWHVEALDYMEKIDSEMVSFFIDSIMKLNKVGNLLISNLEESWEVQQ